MSEESKHELDPEYARHVFKYINDGLALTDDEGLVVYINPALEQITGYTFAELAGRKLSYLVHQKFHKVTDRAFKKINEKNSAVYEIRLNNKNGKTTDVCVRMAAVRKSEVYKGAAIIIRDITDSRDEKGELKKALSDATTAKNEREKFLASMSHEVRTPMTGILGMTQMLLKTNLDIEQRDYLESIEISARSLTKILNDILDYSTLDVEKTPLNQKIFRLEKSVVQICNNFMIRAGEKGIDLSVHVDDSLPNEVFGDEGRYLQVLMQVLANACKFTEEGFVKVSVSGEPGDGNTIEVKTTVEDTGEGIPEEIRNNLFESFSKASRNTMSIHGGTGLGLAIVKKLVNLMGGSIEVAGRKGEGTIITMIIPFGLKSAVDGTAESGENGTGSNQKLLEGRTILVVDDHPINQKLLVSMLNKSGVEVLTADSGDKALDVYRDHPEVDLILMDIHMPGMDGLEATKKIRSDFGNEQSDVAILAVTASVMSSDVDKINEAGMDDFIAKPFTLIELTDKIVEYMSINKQKNSKAGIQKSDKKKTDKVVDFQSLHEMTSGDQAVMLEMMELFLDQTPPLVDNLESAFEKSDWRSMAETAHKMKPTFTYMGIDEAFEISIELEKYREVKKVKKTEPVAKLINRLTAITSEAYKEIELASANIREEIS